MAVGIPWLVDAELQSLPLSLCGLPLLFLYLFPVRVSFIRTHVIGFSVCPDNPRWSHSERFNFVTFAKPLFPNKVTLTGSRG